MLVAYTDILKYEYKEQKIKNPFFAKRIKELSCPASKTRSYLSYLLLRAMVKDIYSVDLDNIKIIRNEAGKPICEKNDFYFSISHSKNYVAVAVDILPVSIDIEQMHEYDSRIANKVFPDQVETIDLAKNQKEEFTKQWTKYECQIKLFGSTKEFKKHSKNKIYEKSVILRNLMGDDYFLSIASVRNDDIHFANVSKYKLS